MSLKAGVALEELAVDNPEFILDLATQFVNGGTDIILIVTFECTSMRMKESRYSNRVPEINLRAAQPANQVSAPKPGVLVAGSIGPTGSLNQPYCLTPHLAPPQGFACTGCSYR